MSHSPDQPIPPRPPDGWHGRGYLPHFEAGDECSQSVTIRLADSVPEVAIARWRDELRGLPESARRTALISRLEDAIDAGLGACHLRTPAVAAMVEAALLFFNSQRYHLHAWVVMPNHVHALFTPTSGHTLSRVVGGWKSFTAKEANKLLGRVGQFWQEDYFDRFIRGETHFEDAREYIENNPVKAGLCASPEEWPFGSASRRRARPG